MTLLAPHSLFALGAVPLLALVLFAAHALRRRAMARFFGEGMRRPERTGVDIRPARLRALLRGSAVLLGLALVTVALARPAYDPQPRRVTRTGRDVVFVVDVSRSMLAQDLKPSRLERAKLAVRDVLDIVEGDRIGIVAFAGTAVVKCPLTTDYAFARMALDDLSPDSILRGGTQIGPAIDAALELLAPGGATDKPEESRVRDIFLITDGEDHSGSAATAAEEAKRLGARIVAISLGSDSVGAPVPAPATQGPGSPPSRGGYIEHEGRRVESRADPESLSRIAEAGAEGGVFLNVGVGNIELDTVYKRLMRDAERRKLDDTEAVKYTEAFQLLLAAALALLCIEPLLGWRWRR